LLGLGDDGVQGSAEEGQFGGGRKSREVNDFEEFIHFAGIAESGVTGLDGLDVCFDQGQFVFFHVDFPHTRRETPSARWVTGSRGFAEEREARGTLRLDAAARLSKVSALEVRNVSENLFVGGEALGPREELERRADPPFHKTNSKG
jgi:hypothetical protein